MKVTFEDTTDDKKIAYIDGEIDTTTAKELEEILDENVTVADNLVLDFAKVTLISSTGLRVLMKMQKQMSTIGSMVIINVNDDVYDVLRMVKLTDILNVSRQSSDEESIDAPNIDALNFDESQLDNNFNVEEYELDSEDLKLLNSRIRHLNEQGRLRAYSISDDMTKLGFAVYQLSKSGSFAYVLFMHIDEGIETENVDRILVNGMQKKLSEQGVQELYIICKGGSDMEKLADSLYFRKSTKTNFILTYNKKQIVESPLFKQIDKLRTMFDRIKIYDELDYMSLVQLEQMMGEDDFEDIDKLYARIFVCEGEVMGMLNAQEIDDNNILISKIKVMSCKEAQYAQPLMLGSLLDAIAFLLEDDNLIYILNSEEKLLKSYKQVLGEPLETSEDLYYRKNI